MKYISVGLLTVALYFIIFTISWKTWNFHYRTSVTIGYFTAVLFNFTANRYFTYQGHTHPALKQMIKYAIVMLINYCITLGVVQFVVEFLKLSPYLGIFFSISVTASLGYLLMKYWVFHKKSNP